MPRDQAVGTDAFFVFDVTWSGTDLQAMLAALSVDVRSPSTAGLAGTTQLLKNSGLSRRNQALVGWSSNEPVEAGAELDVSIAVVSSVGSTRYFGNVEVHAASDVPALEFALEDWLDVARYTGATVTCGYDCGIPVGFQVDPVQSTEVVLHGRSTGSRIAVAREFEVGPVPGKGTFLGASGSWVWTGGDEVVGPHLEFGERLDEYCVRINERDLRNDTTRSAEVCGAPPRPLTEEQRDTIGRCTFESLAPEFQRRYCSESPRNQIAGCDPYRRGVEPLAGTGGMGAASPGAELGGNTTVAGGTNAGNSDPAPPAPEHVPNQRRTSSAGCGFSSARAGAPCGALMPAVLFVFAALGRRRSKRG